MTATDPFANIPNADDEWNTGFPPVINDPGLQYDIIERTGRAEYYLREARRAGLPLPGYVTISAHDFGEWRSSAIGVQLASPDEVSQWARHFGTAADSGRPTSVIIEKTGQHDVVAYCGQQTDESVVPGLTEHTEAAPAYEPKCGDRVTGPRGLATVVDTASFGNASKVEYDEPHRYVIELNGHLSPAEGTAGYLQALAEHTEAACDTITRAAQ